MAEILSSLVDLFDPFTLTVIAIFLGIGLIFSPTRAVIAWAFKILSDLVSKLVGALFTFLHEAGSRVIDAHVVYFKNWKPRAMVIKTVKAEKGTRRI